MQSQIGHFLDVFFASERLRSQVVFQETLAATPAVWADPQQPFPDSLRNVLESAGIRQVDVLAAVHRPVGDERVERC